MPELNAAIEGVLDYIHAHIEEPLTLPELARYAAYSQYHFSRLFKQRLGISLRDYVASLRLHRAKELLLSTNLNVRQIALEIGHQSLGTFTTRFTAKVGVTPLEYQVVV